MSEEIDRASGDRLVSQKDYADARGWSKQYVNQLVKKGRIHLVDGLIDPQQADRALGRTRDPARAAAFRTDGMEEADPSATGADLDVAARVHGSFAKARTVREHYRALRERLEYAQLAGQLVSRQEVDDEQFTLARMTQERLIRGMHDIAESVAAQFKIEGQGLRDTLVERVTELLNRIASEIEKLGDEVSEGVGTEAEPVE